MDRARVICPSLSIFAHATGVTMLGLAVLVLPERLPERAVAGPIGPWAGPLVDLGRAPGGGPPVHGRVPRVTPPARIVAPVIVPPIEIGASLGEGVFGIEGFPDSGGGPGLGPGTCLSNCGPGPTGSEVGAVLPPLEKKEHRPVRIWPGGDLQPPVKRHDVSPVYPPLALASRVEGRVRLDCVIDEQGRVSAVSVLDGHPLFDAAAIAAVRQWRYSPTLLNGEAVSVQLEVTVDFRLR